MILIVTMILFLTISQGLSAVMQVAGGQIVVVDTTNVGLTGMQGFAINIYIYIYIYV